jgi:dienelactone hydrolase
MLAVGLVLVLLGGFGAGLVKTAGGSITVRQLRWETGSGHELAAELFIPKNATPDHPAPAIACSHGWQVNSEYQEAFYIEFARRGYVVVAIDMYGHGDSEAVAFNTWWSEDGATGANGLYDAVQMLAGLPFVDADQIGVTGHSNGGTATNLSVLLDNEAPAPLIDAALIVANEPLATRDQTLVGAYLREDSGDFHNPYGGRDVGVIAGQYDEVFHRYQWADGTVDPARDFVTGPTAQSFLHFGADPAGLPERSGDAVYRQTIDGQDAMRVIFNPTAVHNLLFIAPSVVADAINFFEQALPAPHPLPAGNQIAPWKPIASAVGAAGLMIVFVSFFLVMLRTRYFGVLAAPGPWRRPRRPGGAGSGCGPA